MPLNRGAVAMLVHVLERDGFFTVPLNVADLKLVRTAVKSISRAEGWPIRTETWYEGKQRILAVRRLDVPVVKTWRYEAQTVLKTVWRVAAEEEAARARRAEQRQRFNRERKRTAEAVDLPDLAPVVRIRSGR